MTDTSTPALIRSSRTALNLTQQQLGELCGYTGTNAQRYVQGWETGVRKVPRDKVQKVAETLKINPLELL